jgi:hypothetical protein
MRVNIAGGTMRKIILMLLLAVVSSSAMAEWIFDGEAEWIYVGRTDESTVYFNSAKVLKTGNRTIMWELFDYEIPQKDIAPHLSEISQIEFDCKEELYRGLDVSYYSKPMGAGKPVYAEKIDSMGWHRILPDSIIETIFKQACDKKHVHINQVQ